MKHTLTMVSAASVVFLTGLCGGSVIARAVEPHPEQTQQPMRNADRQEVSGRIEAVDPDRGVVQVQGTSVPIVTTQTTRYARGLSFEALKPGMPVRILAVLRSDGKLEALEVRSA